MLIFIDESGDSGLKVHAGSSKYFVVALVGFEDHNEVLAVDERISLLRKEQRLPDNFEFHFNKLKPGYRRTFLATVARYNFFYLAVVMNKANLAGHEFDLNESLYKYACGLIFENAKSRLSNAIVVIDESGSKNFKSELKRYLVRRLKDDSGKCFIKKIRTQDSSKNNLIQLADMIVGAVARSFSGKKDADECRNLITHREINVEVWPK
jgi:hypothetical protein